MFITIVNESTYRTPTDLVTYKNRLFWFYTICTDFDITKALILHHHVLVSMANYHTEYLPKKPNQNKRKTKEKQKTTK